MANETLSHYRVEDKIGEGGMGAVYRALDLTLNRSVALKIIHERLAHTPGARERVVREAQLVASLNHPNVCTIYEVFSVDRDSATAPAGAPVIVLELMEGQTLRDYLARAGPLQPKHLLDIAIQITDGLVEAHRWHIVHRDLKPQNIFITPAHRVKILDFGLAKAVAEQSATADASTRADFRTDPMTAHGVIMGTSFYMSPEQASGVPVDHRSDIFSLGILLYEMASGVRPFTGDTTVQVLAKILEAEPASLLEVRPGVPADIDRIIRRCLQKNPNDRYNDTRDLYGDLKEAQDAFRLSTDPRMLTGAASGAPAPMTLARTRRLPLVVAAVLGGALLVLLIVFAGQHPKELPVTRQAVHRQITFLGDASYPAISPDGNFIAYVRGEPWEENNALLQPLMRQKVVIQDLAGGGRPLEVADCVSVCSGLAWSPDSTALLVGDGALKLIPRFGGDLRSIIGGLVAVFAWSPSGSEIAHIRRGVAEIRFLDLATNQSRAIPVRWSSSFVRGLDWSPRDIGSRQSWARRIPTAPCGSCPPTALSRS